MTKYKKKQSIWFVLFFQLFLFQVLMVKKVRTYLNNAEIVEDENRLLDVANQYEPSKKFI